MIYPPLPSEKRNRRMPEEQVPATPPKSELIKSDLTTESWREYDFIFNEVQRTYRINNPVTLYLRKTGKEHGSTHRVVDDKGITHCVPAPGVWGCVLRWQAKDLNAPVTF